MLAMTELKEIIDQLTTETFKNLDENGMKIWLTILKVLIRKHGDRHACNNYRGIRLEEEGRKVNFRHSRWNTLEG